jgi:hypothetical protein
MGDTIMNVLTPSENGTYTDGTYTRVQSAPFNAMYGPSTLSPNGRLIQHVGEFGSSFNPPYMSSCTFHPGQDAWTSVTTQNLEPENWVTFHSEVFITDNGDLVSGEGELKRNQPLPGNVQQSRWYNGVGINLAKSIVGEAALCRLPNGDAVCFSSNGTDLYRFSPGYSSEYVSAGSSSQSVGVTKIDCTQRMIALNASVPGLGGFRKSLRWVTQGNAQNNEYYVNYEQGPTIYMPKIDRVVLIGGNGYIYTITTDLNPANLNIAAILPLEPLHPHPFARSGYIGTVYGSRTFDIGTGLYTFVSGYPNANSFVVDIDPNRTPPKIQNQLTRNWSEWADGYNNLPVQQRGWYVRPSGADGEPANPNRGWFRGRSTTARYYSNFKQLVFSGSNNFNDDMGLGQNGTPTQHGHVRNGDQVTFGRPSYIGMDAPAAILPNGDLVFSVSSGGEFDGISGGFDAYSTFMVWDGTNTPTFLFNDQRGISGQPTFYQSMFPLPSGEIHFGSYIYVPTTTQQTPVENSRPIITNVPTVLQSGLTFVLSGNQLNGLHEGAAFGDDKHARTNFPIISLTSQSNGKVYYCRSTDWSYYGIQPNRPSTVKVTIPSYVPEGMYSLRVIASGVPSNPITREVRSSNTSPLMMG